MPLAVAALAVTAYSAYSANKAAKTQAASAQDANAEQGRQYDQTRTDQLALQERQRQDQQPWMDAGKASLADLSTGMAPGGRFTKPFSLADYAADPGYQFRVQQGEQGINRAAAARGGWNSGATLKALARFNQDQGSQEYGNAYTRFNNDQNTQVSRLQSLAGIGQSATNVVGQQGSNAYGQIANAGQNASNNIAQNMMGAGNARASGYVGGANAINGGISQYMNYTQNQNMLDAYKASNSAPTRVGSTSNPYTGSDFVGNNYSGYA